MTFQPSLGTAAVAVGREEFLLLSAVSPRSSSPGCVRRENRLEYLRRWDGKHEPNGKPDTLTRWKLVHSAN